ncbi:hypothetical protein [Legionella fallonii]|uniref:HPr kinase n=1 Tax=Legionella fallonii LLAP-10 TaxID=1212491 RepID=A0A098G194_9GAMM|nr:hypothetical protein [Legionella fallonii]CEG55754.1 protein of unknown function [Legionella fallonii LLAP-10]
MFHFQSYGLTLRSSILLPGYKHLEFMEALKIDAEIIEGKVSSKGINNPVEQGLFFQVNPNEIWFNIPNVARFLVQNGECIIMEPKLGVDENTLALFLSDPCLVALLMQRGLFVLTGSVLQINDTAIAYLGEHCSGKSSIVAALMQQGYSLMSDGLCVVNQDGLVFSGPAHIELWEDRIKSLDIPLHGLQNIRPGLKKYRLPIHESFSTHPLPLKNVYAINLQKVTLLHSKNLTGSEKINFLQKNIYNKTFLSGLKKNQLYFNYCARLARQIQMALVTFNVMEFNTQDMIACMLESANG